MNPKIESFLTIIIIISFFGFLWIVPFEMIMSKLNLDGGIVIGIAITLIIVICTIIELISDHRKKK